jgi:diguanylate cyclase (GGDEF)-like protein
MRGSEAVSGSLVHARSSGSLAIRACWIPIAIAVSLYALAFAVDSEGPALGMRWRGDGTISEFLARGPAAQAGLIASDRLLSIDDVSIASRLPVLYQVKAGVPVGVVVLRGSSPLKVLVLPVTRWGERKLCWRSGGVCRVRAVSDVLRLGSHALALLLGALLLGLRPRVAAARIAAVALACWGGGGNNLIAIPGFGALFTGFSPSDHAFVAILDLLFLAGFFALLLHFVAVFPTPLPVLHRHRAFEFVPYVAVLPFAGVLTASVLRFYWRAVPDLVPQLPPGSVTEAYGPGLVAVGAVLLALRFRTTGDRADRRRIAAVLVSMLPVVLTWIVALSVAVSSQAPAVRAFAAVLEWAGMGAGVGIFAYAVMRHRLFGVHPVVRKGILYAVARGALALAMLLPAGALALYLYERRQESLVDLASRDAAVPVLILMVAVFVWRWRQTFIEAIDRRFFREEYDARHALLRVLTMIQRGTDITVLGRVALLEIEKALHPVHLSLWLLDSGDRHFQPVIWRGEERSIAALLRSSAVIQMLESGRKPVEIERPIQPDLLWLPPEDQGWIEAMGAALIVPLSVDRDIMGFLLLGERLSEEPYSDDDDDLLMAIGGQLALTEDYGRLEILARKDPLTEALNRHAFYSLIEKKRVFPFDQGTAGSVAVVDVNDLKRINDTYGHGAGDLAIRHVASAVRGVVRADDLVFRWGGDEFLVVLFGLASTEVIRRLDSIGLVPIQWESRPIEVGVSFGVASFEEVTYVPAAIEEADRSMYTAKVAQKALHR